MESKKSEKKELLQRGVCKTRYTQQFYNFIIKKRVQGDWKQRRKGVTL